jgi:hypothetical protein
MKVFDILDVCYPDYFRGYHRPVVSVPVWNNMTFSDLAEGIKQELDACWDYYYDPDYPDSYTKTEVLIIEELIDDLNKRGMDIFIGEQFEESEDDDFAECPYAYLSFIK